MFGVSVYVSSWRSFLLKAYSAFGILWEMDFKELNLNIHIIFMAFDLLGTCVKPWKTHLYVVQCFHGEFISILLTWLKFTLGFYFAGFPFNYLLFKRFNKTHYKHIESPDSPIPLWNSLSLKRQPSASECYLSYRNVIASHYECEYTYYVFRLWC